jgi:threonine dehydrogenase-like Zn-dependent dehydrogenase
MCGCQHLKLYGIDQDGAFAERIAVKANNAFVLPENVSNRDAATLEPFSIATHGTRRAAVDPADIVVVIGAGKIGLCVVDVMAKTAAIQVVAVDVRQDRLDIARRLGADVTIDATAVDPVEEVRKLTDGRGADRVVEVVGHAAPGVSEEQPVAQAMSMVRSGGRVVVLGQGPDPYPVFWKPFVWKEAELITSRVTLGEFPRAIAMMERGLLHPDLVVTHELPIERAGEAYEIANDPSAGAVKILIKVAE